MDIHLERDAGDSSIETCADLGELWELMQRYQTEGGFGGTYYYDLTPTLDEQGGKCIVIREMYFGNEE